TMTVHVPSSTQMTQEAHAISLGKPLPDRRRHVAHERDGLAPIAAAAFRFARKQPNGIRQLAQRSGSCEQQRIAVAAKRVGSKRGLPRRHEPVPRDRMRSEEHTSELQSRENLVCRLLLEKKKK